MCKQKDTELQGMKKETQFSKDKMFKDKIILQKPRRKEYTGHKTSLYTRNRDLT